MMNYLPLLLGATNISVKNTITDTILPFSLSQYKLKFTNNPITTQIYEITQNEHFYRKPEYFYITFIQKVIIFVTKICYEKLFPAICKK